MASGDFDLNSALQDSDTYPLLMDHTVLDNEHHHVVPPTSPDPQPTPNEFRGFQSFSMPSSSPETQPTSNGVRGFHPFSMSSTSPATQPTSNMFRGFNPLSISSSSPETQPTSNESRGSHPFSMPSSSPRENVDIAVDPLSISPASTPIQAQLDYTVANSLGRSSSSSSRLQLIPRTSLLRRSSSGQQRRDGNRYSTSQRNNPLNSGLWISLEVAMTISQVIASIIVLALSQDEKPRAPLKLWIMGYTAGCMAILPLLYWRYRQHQARQQDNDAASVSMDSSSRMSNPSRISQSVPHHTSQVEDLESGLPVSGGHQVVTGGGSRMAKHVERFKMALDCFFAVWFVVGNVWIFGGHSSADEAPNLFRLCIVFLTFSCISYAMPLVICATVCCCLPCIVTLLSYREDQGQAKGALPDVIAGLPVYKFRKKGSNSKSRKDENDSDSESHGDGGIFAPGTDKERVVSGDDAVCCICLGKYKDGVDLKELQCAHFFHVDCVEKWLKINATCPLCKHEVIASSADAQSG